MKSGRGPYLRPFARLSYFNRGITLDWCVNKLLNLGKGYYFIKFLSDLCLVHAEYCTIEKK
jgi:hypothetical protein